jgi:AAA family ATP:ADP antiporter
MIPGGTPLARSMRMAMRHEGSIRPAAPLDRALRVFADVRPGEGATALLLALNVFLLLTTYYLLKPVREALILGEGSAELKSYMSAAQVAVLAFVVPLYGRLVASLPRLQLIRIVTWFFVSCLVVFYLLARTGVPLGIVFFIWIGIFNLMAVAQFWAFANDIYTRDEGERLFPIVGFGASLGAVLGAVLAGWLIGPFGIFQMLLIGAAGLLAQLEITKAVERRERARPRPVQPSAHDDAAAPHNAFALVFRSRYLTLIGVMLMIFYCVDSIAEYILGSVVREYALDTVAAGQANGSTVQEMIGRFYSTYFGLVNAGSLLLQLFIVSRVVKYLGVGLSVCIQPALAFLAYNVITFAPSLGFILAAQVSSKSADYSLNNTVRNMLFLPCTREEKYSAKQVIDSLFVRFGDLLSAGIVFLGTAAFGLSTTGFGAVNITLAAVGLSVAFLVGHTYVKLTRPRVVGSQPLVAAGAGTPVSAR